MNQEPVVEVTRLPRCQWCLREAHYDARTRSGRWGYLCGEHFRQHGPGRLGIGLGHRLVQREDD